MECSVHRLRCRGILAVCAGSIAGTVGKAVAAARSSRVVAASTLLHLLQLVKVKFLFHTLWAKSGNSSCSYVRVS